MNRTRWKERDVESQYDYFGARYYDSRIARWLAVDPLHEHSPGFSPYAYVVDNPLGFIDVAGEDTLDGKYITKVFPEIVVIGKRVPRPTGDNVFAGAFLLGRKIVEWVDEVLGLHLSSATKDVVSVFASPVPTGVGGAAAAGEVARAAKVKELLSMIKAVGKEGGKGVYEMTGGVEEAKALFGQLSKGGRVVSRETYSGISVDLPEGGTVGLRTTASRSPGTAATIDVNIPDMAEITKIKFNP